MTATTAHPEEIGVEVNNVTKSFGGDEARVTVLNGVTLSIRKGEFVSLIGPSGCGKSTLLKVVAGLSEANGGSVSINGKSVREAARDKAIGLVPQSPALLPWRTILENVGLPISINPAANTGRKLRDPRELLQSFGLGHALDRYPAQLSGGMQQRAAIARALIHDPKLVLMDEPFGALDALTREKMNLEMLRIWEESHKTFVVVTHSIQEAVFLGSRCAVLTAGPARMADSFPIDLPSPRKLHVKTTPEFGQYVSRVYSLLGVE